MKTLIGSAISGNLEEVIYFINRGDDIQQDDNRALRESARLGHYKIVHLLIEHSANIHEYGDEVL